MIARMMVFFFSVLAGFSSAHAATYCVLQPSLAGAKSNSMNFEYGASGAPTFLDFGMPINERGSALRFAIDGRSKLQWHLRADNGEQAVVNWTGDMLSGFIFSPSAQQPQKFMCY